MTGSLRHLFAALVLLGATTGCTQGRSGPPVGDSTLVDVLVDLHLREGRAAATVPDSLRALGGAALPIERTEILRRHGVDSAAFVRTLDYYRDRLPAYRRVYDRVIDRLQAGQPAPETPGGNDPAP